MATLYTINVTNNSPSKQTFFFFQKPAQYTGGQIVYSNSIYSAALLPFSTSGATLTFNLLQQYYAGVQTQHHDPVVGQASGYETASQPIDLASASGETGDTTTMSLGPGLSVPAYSQGVQPGAFRIITPPFNPVTTKYNLGLAAKNAETGSVVLSNFITAPPSKNVDCQPVVQFYVQTGDYEAGDTINFTTSSIGSALCDGTQGITTFSVSYNADGGWTVNQVSNQPGLSQLAARPHLLYADLQPVSIKNEAGTAVICTGATANANAPLVVSALNNPAALSVHRDYQVQVGAGPYRGYLCIAKAGTTATFA